MLRFGQIVALCALGLLTLGVVMVNSAGMTIDPVDVVPALDATPPAAAEVAASPSMLDFLRELAVSRPVVYMALALAAMAAASYLPLRHLAAVGGGGARDHPRLGLAVLAVGTLVLLGLNALVYVPGLGREVNGAHRWISLPVPGLRAVSVQPSELAKWGLPLVLAIYGASRAAAMPRFWSGLIPALLAIALVAGIVAKEDLGTGVLIAAAGALVLLAAGARFWHFLLFIPPAASAFVLLVVSSPYRLTRIEAFLDPYADPKGTGFHMIQSMAAVAGGGGWGRGLGDGLQKFGYLPEDTTDFLFAIICEELGIAGAVLVIAIYIAMLWAGLALVRRIHAPALKLLGVGILATIGLQAIINLAVVTGLGPTKGIALPLVSAGGTGWILTAASLGLLCAMERWQRRADEPAALPAIAATPSSPPAAPAPA